MLPILSSSVCPVRAGGRHSYMTAWAKGLDEFIGWSRHHNSQIMGGYPIMAGSKAKTSLLGGPGTYLGELKVLLVT